MIQQYVLHLYFIQNCIKIKPATNCNNKYNELIWNQWFSLSSMCNYVFVVNPFLGST